MRRGSIVALLGIGLVAGGVATAVALIPTWLPVDASREAGRIDFVIWFTVAICIALFAVVAAAMVYSIIRFRAAPDDLEDGPSIHGHTGLEIGWTTIPLVIVTAIAIVAGIVLSKDDAQGAPSRVVHVNVQAQQFAFTFSYPAAGNATSPVLRLPVNRSVELDMRSLDVIHAFFVPEFRENEDIVPGMITHVHVTPDRVGTYPFICNELCGLGHGLMRTEVIVMPDKAFDAWLAQQTAGSKT
jgi:cytochrome c oxidase subunit 2